MKKYKILARVARKFFIAKWLGEKTERFFPLLETLLKQAEIEHSRKDFLAITYTSFILSFIFFSILFGLVSYFIKKPIAYSFLFSFILSLMIFLRFIYVPKMIVQRRVQSLEKELLPALEEMIIQLRSGLPLYDIIINISNSNYGEISKEFKKAAKKIASGIKQEIALEELSENNPSLFFRRAVWQLANGIKTGSDIEEIVASIIDALQEQQAIEIQHYGSTLSPLALFYMLVGVILPVLVFTFLSIASALLAWRKVTIAFVFAGFLFLVAVLQLIFIGITKSKRPAILGSQNGI